MALTKDGIAEQIREKLDFPVQQAKDSLEIILEEIKLSLESGNDVKISGFGVWSIKQKKSRPGRNPHTGESIEIAARKVVPFLPSKRFREIVNNSWKRK